MLDNTLSDEAARQFQICNSCRYCEGYCDVFPQLFSLPEMSAAQATHLANLCHNCRGCYYACQYAPPHEFDLNLPAVPCWLNCGRTHGNAMRARRHLRGCSTRMASPLRPC